MCGLRLAVSAVTILPTPSQWQDAWSRRFGTSNTDTAAAAAAKRKGHWGNEG